MESFEEFYWIVILWKSQNNWLQDKPNENKFRVSFSFFFRFGFVRPNRAATYYRVYIAAATSFLFESLLFCFLVSIRNIFEQSGLKEGGGGRRAGFFFWKKRQINNKYLETKLKDTHIHPRQHNDVVQRTILSEITRIHLDTIFVVVVAFFS